LSSIWERIAELHRTGRDFALCTVVKTTGSVPRRPGARMIVFADGSIEGSVGGAGFEEQVKTAALEALAAKKLPALMSFDLWYRKPSGLDSLCGGSVMVSIEPVQRRTHVLIFGGGHVGHALARILDVVEIAYTVVDDRAEYSAVERFPGAAECFTGRPAAFLDDRDLSIYTQSILLGYSYDSDLEALERLLPALSGPVGLIGSRAKGTEMRERLATRGVDQEAIARLRCPIGVDMPTETAGEIALAIAAEILAESRPAR